MKNGLFIRYNGNKEWYFNNKRHRIDGPAIESSNGGVKAWWYDNKRHRVNGPAVEWGNSKAWYFDSIKMEEKEYNAIMYYYNLYQVIIKEIIY